MKNNSSLLTIKEFAVLCRTTPRTLRFYEEKGLIKPVKIDSANNYRLYDPNQAKDFFKIKLLTHFKIPLKEVEEYVHKSNKDSFLEEQLSRIHHEIEEKRKEYEFLKNIRQFLFSKTSGEEYLESEEIGPFILFGLLDKKGRYDRINERIAELYSVALQYRIPTTNHQLVFYHDPVAFKPKDTILEICLVTPFAWLPHRDMLPGGYFFKEFSKTNVKTYTYKGPYEYIVLVYQKLHEDRLYRILKPHEVGFDLHLKGPHNAKSPYDYVTKISFPQKT